MLMKKDILQQNFGSNSTQNREQGHVTKEARGNVTYEILS